MYILYLINFNEATIKLTWFSFTRQTRSIKKSKSKVLREFQFDSYFYIC